MSHSLLIKRRLQRAQLPTFVEQVQSFLSNPQCLALAMEPVGELDPNGQPRGHAHVPASGPGLVRQHHPSTSTSTSHVGANFLGRSPSLLKMLLNVQSIQSALMVCLVELLLEVCDDGGGGADGDGGGGGGHGGGFDSGHLAMRVLNHIRWCDVIYDGGPLLQAFFSVLPALPHALQVEVVTSLPIVTVDAMHSGIVSQLHELGSDTPALVPCILETLANLSLPPRSPALETALSFAVELLTVADVDTVPTVVKFLLEIASADTAPRVISAIRQHVGDFLGSCKARGFAAQMERADHDGSAGANADAERAEAYASARAALSVQALLVDALAMAFITKPVLLQAYVGMVTKAAADKALLLACEPCNSPGSSPGGSGSSGGGSGGGGGGGPVGMASSSQLVVDDGEGDLHPSRARALTRALTLTPSSTLTLFPTLPLP